MELILTTQLRCNFLHSWHSRLSERSYFQQTLSLKYLSHTRPNLTIKSLGREHKDNCIYNVNYFKNLALFIDSVCVQMKYYSDCHRTYSELCAQIDAGESVTTDSLNRTIQQKLSEIRALSISTTDDQL